MAQPGRTIWSTSLNPFGVGVSWSFTLHQYAGRWSLIRLKIQVRVGADHKTCRSSKRWLLQGRSTDSHQIRLIWICTWYFKDYFVHTDIGLSVLRLSFWVSGQCRRSAEGSSLDQLQTQGRPDAVTCMAESSSTKFSCTVQASNSAGTPSLLMHPRANESFATQNSCRLASQLRKEGGQDTLFPSPLRQCWGRGDIRKRETYMLLSWQPLSFTITDPCSDTQPNKMSHTHRSKF